MPTMGNYCKAYYVRQFTEFPAWRPNLKQLRPATADVDGQEVETPRTALADDDILYVQETYVVTDGIFLDQHVIFDGVTPEWQIFCRDVLRFEVPAELAAVSPAAAAMPADAAAIG